MKKILSGILLIPMISLAQNDFSAKISELKTDSKSGIPVYFSFKKGQQPSSEESLAVLNSVFGLTANDQLREYRSEKDLIGYTHHRYQQYYKNLPVEYAEVILHDRSGTIISANGHLRPGIEPSNNIVLSESQALLKAKEVIGAQKYSWEIPGEEESLKIATGNKDFSLQPKITPVVYQLEKTDRFAYKVDIMTSEPLGHWEVYIDAQSGMELGRNSLQQDVDVPGVAKTKYAGVVGIRSDSVAPGSYRLRETSHGNGIETYNLKRGTNIASAVDFTDTDNYWANFNSTFDEVAGDVHMGAEKTYDFYKNTFNRDSYDDKGSKILSYAHYSIGYVNASWNGTYMIYGDGSAGYTPLTSLDICGHELTHGVTGNSAKLIYRSESGALNESFSDIFGNTIEFKTAPDSASWRVGEKINKGVGLRNMAKPNDFSDPDTYNGIFYVNTIGCVPNGGNDQCGVHKNSGVQNFWYYLLVKGGSGKNDIDSFYNVKGLGWDSAAAIAYRNLTVYLTPTSGYEDAAYYAIQAARDLYGDNSFAVEQTTNAWFAVGIGKRFSALPVADFVSNYGCNPDSTFRFKNKSGNATAYSWDFGDGSPVSTLMSPTHQFPQPGSYNVTLIATNVAGSDTLSKTIKILNLNPVPSQCTISVAGINPVAGVYDVEFAGISSQSGDVTKEGVYLDQTCTRGDVITQTNYPITIKGPSTYLSSVRVWLDMNNDGMLTANELIFSSDSLKETHTGTVKIDSAVYGVPLRLRVLEGRFNVTDMTDPCGSIMYGQVEDYAIMVTKYTSGISVKEMKGVQIFPNPGNGRFIVRNNTGRSLPFEVFNMQGEKQLEGSINTDKEEINLTMLPKGVYLFKAAKENTSEMHRLIIY